MGVVTIRRTGERLVAYTTGVGKVTIAGPKPATAKPPRDRDLARLARWAGKRRAG